MRKLILFNALLFISTIASAAGLFGDEQERKLHQQQQILQQTINQKQMELGRQQMQELQQPQNIYVQPESSKQYQEIQQLKQQQRLLQQ